ncbi:MAG: NAD(P)H-dependent oxidoreductase [Bacteroidota bacterium]
MITVISGTNRKGSVTKVFAQAYYDILREELGDQVHFLALEDLPHDWYHEDMYSADQMPDSLKNVQDKYILPAKAFVFLSPEYNGSFSGVLKLFIDACSIRQYKENFQGKQAALVGVSSGRAGNLRGLHHLGGVLNYLGVTTLPDQLPISSVGKLMNDDKSEITDEDTLATLRKHAQAFVKMYLRNEPVVAGV